MPHLREAKYGGSTSIIHNAIRKYGKDAFKIDLLQECCSFEELDEARRRWIAELNTVTPNGYNIEVGGCRNRASHVRGNESENTGNTKASFAGMAREDSPSRP